MYTIPDVDSVWAASDGSRIVTVVEVKKRGRGYYVVTDDGRFRLKDFLKQDLVLIRGSASNA